MVLSFPAATPVTTKTLSSSSLSATTSILFITRRMSPADVWVPAATDPERVTSVTLGAALTKTVIVFGVEL